MDLVYHFSGVSVVGVGPLLAWVLAGGAVWGAAYFAARLNVAEKSSSKEG